MVQIWEAERASFPSSQNGYLTYPALPVQSAAPCLSFHQKSPQAAMVTAGLEWNGETREMDEVHISIYIPQ